MSRAYLHCLNHVQRPRLVDQASISPGSRMSAPWVLRPKRGLPQFTHSKWSSSGDCPARPCQDCKRRVTWNWRERPLQAKAAAFLDATARWSVLPRGKAGVRGRAGCRIHSLLSTTACRRQARTGTVPPFFPINPMPP